MRWFSKKPLQALGRKVAASLNEIYKAIGELTSTVHSIKESVGELKNRSIDAEKQRNNIKDRLDHLSHRVTAVEHNYKSTKEVTDEVKMWKQRGVGALFTCGIGASAISSFLILLVEHWTDLVKLLIGK